MTTKDHCSINFTGLTHDHSLECRGELPRSQVEEEGQQQQQQQQQTNGSAGTHCCPDDQDSYCSAIPILKQHPMYDCLVLVRKYRNCLAGYSLEFPVDKIREHERLPTNESPGHHQQQQQQLPLVSAASNEDDAGTPVEAPAGARSQRSSCSQRRLVSRFLDGDDPVYSRAAGSLTSSLSQGHLSDGSCEQAPVAPTGPVQSNTGTPTGPPDCGTQTDETDARLLFMTQIDDRGQQCHLVHVPINGLLDRLESYTRNGVAVDSRVYAFAMGLKTAERMMTTKSMKELHETPI